MQIKSEGRNIINAKSMPRKTAGLGKNTETIGKGLETN